MARCATPSTMDELSESEQRIVNEAARVLRTTAEGLFQFARTAPATPEETVVSPSIETSALLSQDAAVGEPSTGTQGRVIAGTLELTHAIELPASVVHIETPFEGLQRTIEQNDPAISPPYTWPNDFENGHDFDFDFGLAGEEVEQPLDWSCMSHEAGLPAGNHDMYLDAHPCPFLVTQIGQEAAADHLSIDPPTAYWDQVPPTELLRDVRMFGPVLPPGRSPGARATRPRSRRPAVRDGYFNGHQQTAQTRKRGACIRCKLQRVKCERDLGQQDGCCRACMHAGRSRRARVKGLPCLRDGITDAELVDHPVRPRPAWTRRWHGMDMVDINRWASGNIHTISITQYVTRIGGAHIITYPVEVRQFVPEPGDALARKWRFNELEESYDCARYGIADMERTAGTMKKVVDASVRDSIHFYISGDDKLLHNTYMMAYRYSMRPTLRKEERDLLKAVLRLWTASRMESRSDYICHDDTLGMKPHFCHQNCSNTGLILTPPVFSAQMEIIMTSMILRPTTKQVLRLLRDLIQEQQRKSWFTVYLSLFILLHSCALLTAANVKRARKQGIKVGYFDTQLIEELHHGATILLAYFHHCNKGSHPFSMDWASLDGTSLGEFTQEQRDFMRDLCALIDKEDLTFKKIRKERTVDHEYYFLSQMYDYAWKLPS